MASQLVFEFYNLSSNSISDYKAYVRGLTAGMFHLIEALEQPVATFQCRQ